MPSNIKVSVIVPVYNISKYLKRCLDSIIGQTLKEIEIVVVNDCSPDPLDDAICREYEKLDSRIKYIKHEKNKGPGGTRNTGISQVKGVFLGFVDSDDYIHKDMYKVMYEQAIKNNCDIVQCNIMPIDSEYNEYFDRRLHREKKVFDSVEEKIKCYLKPGATFVDYGMCNKIVRRSVFIENHISFEEKVRYAEDCAPCLKLLYYVSKRMFIPNCFYYYYQRRDSIIHTFKFDLYKDILLYLKQIKDFLKEKNLYNRVKSEYINRYEAAVLGLYHKCYTANKDRVQEFENAVRSGSIYSESKGFRVKFKLFRYIIKMNVFYFARGIFRLKKRLMR